MKLYFEGRGDPDVGIWPASGSFECNIDITDKEDRERTRKEFIAFIDEFSDDRCEVFFEDECPECLTIEIELNKCPNKDCMSNYMEENK